MTMGLALLIWPALAEPETHSPDTLDLDWYLLDRGDSRARERLAHAAVTGAPDSAAAHRAASYILAREDHSGETLRIEMYRRWVEETPDQPAARVGLAETLFWSDRDNSERCEAVQAALDHIGDSDPRARFEALQLAWMAGGVTSTSNPELAWSCPELPKAPYSTL